MGKQLGVLWYIDTHVLYTALIWPSRPVRATLPRPGMSSAQWAKT